MIFEIFRKIKGPHECTDAEYPVVWIKGNDLVCCLDAEAVQTYIDYCKKPKEWYAISKESVSG